MSFLKNKLNERLKIFPEFANKLKNDFEKLENFGVNSNEKHDSYLKLIRYSNRNSNLNKTAYPIGYEEHYQKEYDTSKWAKVAQQLYYLTRIGKPFEQTFNELTKDWDAMEKTDFTSWMNFYSEGGDKKYKRAQFYPNTFQLKPEQLKAELPTANVNIDVNDVSFVPELTEEQKKKLVAKKVQAILGRLTAAERLATDPEIRDILSSKLDIDLNAWLELLHQIKRMIQTAPIKNIYSSILEDLIIKESNKLKRDGFYKAASELIFLVTAQDANIPAVAQSGNTPTPLVPTNNVAGTAPAAIVPPVPAIPTPPAPKEKKPGELAMEKLIEGMNFDENEIRDSEPDDLANIKILAQQAPEQLISPQPQEQPAVEQIPAPEQPVEQISEPTLEQPAEPIAENESEAQAQEEQTVDNIFDAALANVTVHDVITELEALANVFRVREIPRKFSYIDLMMDKLNISTFFPSLGEANSKTLEGNQYSLTRVEEALSRLRGAVATPKENEIDLSGSGQVDNSGLRGELQKRQNVEKAVKEKRKQDAQMQDLAPESTPVAPELAQAMPAMPEAQAPIAPQRPELNPNIPIK